MIFHHALRLQGKDSIELKDQFFLYIGGEGGTGKYRIIEAVRLGMMLLQRKNEILVLGPTGNCFEYSRQYHTYRLRHCSAGSSQKRTFCSREGSLDQ